MKKPRSASEQRHFGHLYLRSVASQPPTITAKRAVMESAKTLAGGRRGASKATTVYCSRSVDGGRRSVCDLFCECDARREERDSFKDRRKRRRKCVG